MSYEDVLITKYNNGNIDLTRLVDKLFQEWGYEPNSWEVLDNEEEIYHR